MASLGEIITGIILVSLFITVLSFTIADLGSNYDQSLSEEMNASIDNFTQSFQDVTGDVSQARNESFTVKASQELDDGIDPVNALTTTKNMITNGLGVVLDMTEQVQERLNIRSEWQKAFIAIFVITLVLMFLAAVLKMRFTN